MATTLTAEEGRFSQESEVARRIGRLFDNSLCSDVTLVVHDPDDPTGKPTRIFAHRAILAVASEPFRALVAGHFSETSERVVEIRDVFSSAFRLLLRFVYTGEVVLDFANVISVLALADRFDLPDLKAFCSSYVRDNINKENVCDLLEASKFYNAEELAEQCTEFLLENVDAVLSESRDCFSGLREDTLAQLLQNDDLCVDELTLFKSVVRWGQVRVEQEYNASEGSEVRPLETAMKALLPHIRFPLIPARQLRDEVAPLRLVPPDLLVEALFFQAAPKPNEAGSTARTRMRNSFERNRFTIDPVRKGSGLVVSEDGCTLTGHTGSNFHTALGTKSFSHGRHYWEVSVVSSAGDGHVRLGVALGKANLEAYLGAQDKENMIGWFQSGYVEGMFHGGSISAQGRFHAGDVCGLLLDLEAHQLVFYVNRKRTGLTTACIPQQMESHFSHSSWDSSIY